MYQDWRIDNFRLRIRYRQQIHIQVCRFIITNNNFQKQTFYIIFNTLYSSNTTYTQFYYELGNWATSFGLEFDHHQALTVKTSDQIL